MARCDEVVRARATNSPFMATYGRRDARGGSPTSTGARIGGV